MSLSKSLSVGAAFLALAASAPLPHLHENAKNAFAEGHHILTFSRELDAATISLLKDSGADHFAHSTFKVDTETKRKLETQEVEFEESTTSWLEHFEEVFGDPNFMCVGESCAEMDTFYESYQQLPALHQRARDNVAGLSYATVTSLGESYEGRDQLAVEIGDDSKPLVFYWCNIHAREWLTPMACSWLVETLVADGGHPLLDTFSFTIVISANPDGYTHSYETDNLWRKTRRPNYSGFRSTRCVGTDPNRNYDFYHCGEGTSNSFCSDVYCGPEPFSEVEVSNIRDYALAHKERLIATNDVHAYGGMWMIPYGAIPEEAPTADYNKQMACSKAAVDAVTETSGQVWRYGPIYSVIYPAAGSSVDWMYESAEVVYAMTAEVRGSSFQPRANNIIPSNNEVFQAMQASLACIAEEEGLSLSVLPAIVPNTEEGSNEGPCPYLFC